MKLINLLFFICTSIFSILVVLSIQAFKGSEDIQGSPQAALGRYIEATNSHDFDQVLPLLDSTAVFWFQEKEYKGHQQVRVYFEGTWQLLPDEKYSIENVNWLFSDKTAATCLFNYSYQGTYKGKSIAGKGKGTNVFRKVKGQWLLIHEHLTPLK